MASRFSIQGMFECGDGAPLGHWGPPSGLRLKCWRIVENLRSPLFLLEITGRGIL